MRTVRESHGDAAAVEDQDVMVMRQELGRREGIYAGQSSVSSIAGQEARRTGKPDPDSTLVCAITSGGLKDVETPALGLPRVSPIPPDWDAFLDLMKSTYGFDV